MTFIASDQAQAFQLAICLWGETERTFRAHLLLLMWWCGKSSIHVRSYVTKEPKRPPKISNKKSRSLHPNL
jgi:hypothetical protein